MSQDNLALLARHISCWLFLYAEMETTLAEPKIKGGYILLARELLNAEIWFNKPGWWLKVWLYILERVNHKDNNLFKRGENYFNCQMIYDNCNLGLDRVKLTSVDNVTRYLKATGMVTTQKTTRGMKINVCKYSFYQNPKNYENAIDNGIENGTGTEQERNTNGTINNNDKNIKKKDLILYIQQNKHFTTIPEPEDYVNTLLEVHELSYLQTQLKEMNVWLESNPAKRYKNYRKFISGWLKRSKTGLKLNIPGGGGNELPKSGLFPDN